MNKLTKEEYEYFIEEIMWAVENNDNTNLIQFIEQKKKQWQEEAIRNYLEGGTEDALCLD